MGIFRAVEQVITGRETFDGAGVKLNRIFSHNFAKELDPFLLLDNFGSDDPSDYLPGFPWHPHRGIETITYMLSGEVDHGDSMGNNGKILTGDVQWMTAGSGIIHQEMPQKAKDRLSGLQLWVNLPKSKKMMKPRYRGITAKQIPEVKVYPGVSVKVIAGSVGSKKGPVKDIVIDMTYLDFSMAAHKGLERKVNPKHTAFAFVYEGEAIFVNGKETKVSAGSLALFGKGSSVQVKTGARPAKFILVTGEPIKEPIAWGGPIVMNTKKELEDAFKELEAGTFVRDKPKL
ncbi:MAG: pirin family protein [Candidatus Micrarchaeia archaeon]